ncbi:hypothetical protein QBE52_18970 [Clostridiaceae bacterium 35-E11]
MPEAIKTAIQAGFTDLTTMVTDVVVIGVPAVIGVMAIAKGARYGIRWVKSMLSNA